MAIYTRTGDKGKTSLFSGKRVWKDNARVEAYGSIDELNSALGIAAFFILEMRSVQREYLFNIVIDVQTTLFYLGSYLADLPDALSSIDLGKKTVEFEKQIDTMALKMPKLSHFILPGGGGAGSFLQFSRTVARRAERRLITLSKTEKIDRGVIVYINRLSDLLFTLSRYANFIEKKKEVIWKR